MNYETERATHRESEREGAKQEQEIFGKSTGNVYIEGIVSHRQCQC